MKYDKTTPILDLDGTQLKDGDVELTLGYVLISGLTMEPFPDPRNPAARMSGQEKNQRFLLALRIQQAEQFFELTLEEAARAKAAVEIFPPKYVGRCYELLEKSLA